MIKPIENFNWRRKAIGQRDTYCRPCRAEYHHEHYLRNKERYIEQARVRKDALTVERITYLLEYFETHPCQDCGETDPVILEFDHQGNKLFNIGSQLSYRAWPSILAEIEKCDVVCCNCHRRRHAVQRGSNRFLLARARRLRDDRRT